MALIRQVLDRGHHERVGNPFFFEQAAKPVRVKTAGHHHGGMPRGPAFFHLRLQIFKKNIIALFRIFIKGKMRFKKRFQRGHFLSVDRPVSVSAHLLKLHPILMADLEFGHFFSQPQAAVAPVEFAVLLVLKKRGLHTLAVTFKIRKQLCAFDITHAFLFFDEPQQLIANLNTNACFVRDVFDGERKGLGADLRGLKLLLLALKLALQSFCFRGRHCYFKIILNLGGQSPHFSPYRRHGLACRPPC